MSTKSVFLIGIGGAGMSALARYFLSKNYFVFGYDREISEVSKVLRDLGATISTSVSESMDAIESNSIVHIIRTPAVKETHPLMLALKDHKVVKRSDELGVISRKHNCLAVAGAHGKTTISSMLAKILAYEKKPMIAFLGGDCKDFESNYYEVEGEDQRMVVEADEYDRTFLKLSPQSAIISNLDADHLDIYKDEKGVIEGFNQFANIVCGKLLVHQDHSAKVEKTHVTYGLEGDFSYELEGNALTFCFEGRSFHFESPFLGIHNIENALGAFALAVMNDVNPDTAIAALLDFKGVKRRAEFVVQTEQLTFIDDYAHHPSEIKVLKDAIDRQFPGKKVLGVFQPHLFSRTQDFVADFRKELGRWDKLLLLDIYPAREEPIPGVTSQWLIEGIRGVAKPSSLSSLLEDVQQEEFDVLVVFGAGSIGTKVKDLKEMLI
jgi:UDP-N-acetylmuramate--alanine ligase